MKRVGFPYTEALIGAAFKTPPFDHQIREFEASVGDDARALAWTMRTGKTKACIDKSCQRYLDGHIDAVLIFAPNGVHANWIEKEFPKHCWDSVPFTGLVWRSTVAGSKAGNRLGRKRKAEWAAERAAWWTDLKAARVSSGLFVLSINSESMVRADVRKVIARFLKSRRVHLIVDECDDFATPGAKRTKMIRGIAKRCAVKTILSGTLLTGGLLGAFSQFEILEPGALGFTTYKEFKEHFAEFEQRKRYGGNRYWAFKNYKNETELRERIAKYTSVVLREECTDMPDLDFDPLMLQPSPEQLAIYRELHREFRVLVGQREVSIGERTNRFIKLQQVMSGFLKDEWGDVHTIPGVNPRLEALSDQCYRAPGKTIIWCNFHEDMDAVTRQLLADGRNPVAYHGRVSNKAKSHALIAFANDRDVTDLVGHPQAGGRGLDMSVASSIFWYSHTFSARLRSQALERATKIGGKNIRIVDFIMPGPDVYIRSKVDERINVNDAIAGAGLRTFLKGLKL